MKNTYLSKTLFAATVVASLAMTACGKKDDSSVRVAGRGGTVGATSTSAMPANTATCSNGQTGTGTLQTTQEAVLSLVSATIDPQSFGTICKVNFSANLKYDGNGNLAAGSTILIQIVDDWVGQVYNGKTIAPYEIQFTYNAAANSNAGTYNRSTGAFTANFGDDYGTFQVSGQTNGATATGTISFANTKAVQGYSPTQGPLGQFSIATSVLFK